MELDKINNESVVNIVVDKIKQSILKGELKSGDKLPTEVELIEQLGVGRNSIREAVKMLTALGILEVRRGQGTYVVEKVKPTVFDPLIFSFILEPKTNQDLYELRYMFDSMVVINVLSKITNEQIELIENKILEVKEKYESDKDNIDYDYFVEKDLEFHKSILEITNNPLIIRFGSTILELFPEYIRKSIIQENGIERSIKNHLRIIETIKQKDITKIIKIVEESLVEWKNEWKSNV